MKFFTTLALIGALFCTQADSAQVVMAGSESMVINGEKTYTPFGYVLAGEGGTYTCFESRAEDEIFERNFDLEGFKEAFNKRYTIEDRERWANQRPIGNPKMCDLH